MAQATFVKRNRYYFEPEKWLRITFGKHNGKTLPQILFEDPRNVAWLYDKHVLLKRMHSGEYPFKLAHQIEVIQNRMRRIKPPAGYKFAIVVDDAGVFRNAIPLKKGRLPKKPLKKGWKIVEWRDLLDFTTPLQFNKPKLGFEYMRQFLMTLCFGDANAKVYAKECKDFVEDIKRFDTEDITCHKWLKAALKDRAALETKFLRLKLEPEDD